MYAWIASDTTEVSFIKLRRRFKISVVDLVAIIWHEKNLRALNNSALLQQMNVG